MRICTIRSSMMMDPGDSSPGVFELDVRIPYLELKNSGAPQAYAQKVIAEHLASCVASTKIPLKEKMWHVEFSDWAQKNLNFPAGFTA